MATLNSFDVDGAEVEVVGSFTLLGSLIDNKGHCASEMKRRLVLGMMAMGKLERVWKDRDISQRTKLRIVKTLCFHSSHVRERDMDNQGSGKKRSLPSTCGVGGVC